MFLFNAFIDMIRIDRVGNKGDKGVVNKQVQLGRDIQITQDKAYLNQKARLIATVYSIKRLALIYIF